MIGSKTGKVTDFATRIKKCRVCDYSSKKETAARKHDCQKNWNDTVKSVESDMAVSMLRRSSSHGKVQVKSITTDSDTTTSLKVKTEIRRDIKQIKDFNHTKGMDLQKIYKNLTPKVVEYFQNCFAIVLQKNKNNDPIKIQAGLLNTVDHAFGEHGKCGSSWCGFLQNPEGCKHQSLPHGKDLEGPKLREDLTSPFKVFASNAAMLAPVGSTQANESFNQVVVSKAPKSRHYSGSDSLNFRVSAAVCQKNIGQVYLSNVFKRVRIKTHSVTEKFAKKVAARAKKRKLSLLSVPYKKRRLELKASRQRVDVILEAREGGRL